MKASPAKKKSVDSNLTPFKQAQLFSKHYSFLKYIFIFKDLTKPIPEKHIF